jgi:hypothetical protein
LSTGGQARTSRWGAGGGAVAQPAITAAASNAPIEDNRAARDRLEVTVGWVFLEIGIALALAVAIVWWTLPGKTKSREENDEP